MVRRLFLLVGVQNIGMSNPSATEAIGVICNPNFRYPAANRLFISVKKLLNIVLVDKLATTISKITTIRLYYRARPTVVCYTVKQEHAPAECYFLSPRHDGNSAISAGAWGPDT